MGLVIVWRYCFLKNYIDEMLIIRYSYFKLKKIYGGEKFFFIGLDCIVLNVFWISFWLFFEEFNVSDDFLFWMSVLIVWVVDLM